MKCPNCESELVMIDIKVRALQNLLETHRELLGLQPGESCIEELKRLTARSEVVKIPKIASLSKRPPILSKEDRQKLCDILDDLGYSVDVRDSTKRLLRKALRDRDEIVDREDLEFVNMTYKRLSSTSDDVEELS